MERDYIFYRKKAGLDFDKFIKNNPEKDGEGLFQTFMKRYDCYYTQRDSIVKKYNQRILDEHDTKNFSRIEAEKMYAIAQLEQVFIDVMRVIFGLSPDDENAKFGDTIATRYMDLIKSYITPEKPGFYKGADGLYRIIYFYDDEIVPLETMREYYLHKDIMYHDTDENDEEPPSQLLIDDKLVEIPKQIRDDPLKIIDKLIEIRDGTYEISDEEVDECFKDKEEKTSLL